MSNFTHDRNKGSESYCTPQYIIDALGDFDLDPCISMPQPVKTAENGFNIVQDGLSKNWFGRVFMNPPYGRKTHTWMKKLKEHGNGIALIFARVETRTWAECVWEGASGVFFLSKRIKFIMPSGESPPYCSGAPSALVSYGDNNSDVLRNCNLDGVFISEWSLNRYDDNEE